MRCGPLPNYIRHLGHESHDIFKIHLMQQKKLVLRIIAEKKLDAE